MGETHIPIVRSEDQFLLQKVVHVDCVKRVIDWQSLGITKEYINEQCKLKYGPFDEKYNFTDNRVRPTSDEEWDRWYVTELCMPYNPPPDDRDYFVEYNDIRALSGTAGYLRIRDGYVWGQKITTRS